MGATNNMVDKRNKNDLGKDDDFVETLPNIKPLGSTQEPVTPVLYSDNIGTPPPTNNGTNGAKYADGLTDTGSTGAGLTGSVATGTEPPKMTYEEYINNSMEFAEERKKFADKQAELAKNRQMIDANSSYMRNKATYGENAEKLAQMGLSGGGYSDYINAQAYAQKRDDVQNANALYSQNLQQNEATYKEYIMSLNKELAQKYLEDERIEQQHTYEDGIRAEQSRETMYKGLFADVQDNPQNFTDEAIDKIAKEYGFSDEQTQSIKDMLKTSKENYSKQVQDTIFGGLLESVTDLNTTYTGEIVRELATEYGLDDKKTNLLIDLLNATLTKQAEAKKSTAKAIIAENGGIMDSEIESALVDLGYTADEIAELKTRNQETVANAYGKQISGYASAGDIDSLGVVMGQLDYEYSQGNVSQEKYQECWGQSFEAVVKDISTNADKLGASFKVLEDIETAYKQGKITESDYRKYKNKVYDNGIILNKSDYEVDGDDINVTINGKEYDLDINKGDYVESANEIALLNEITTGSKDKSPKEGTIIKMFGKMYCYTDYGGKHWFNVQNDGDKVEAVDKAIPSNKNREIARKAQTGTLTYEDVAEYCPGVMTAREFKRGYAKAKEYSSYQAYLKAMYDKYS